MKRPPPIQYLVAFVSAARTGSFSKTSEELHVTPSAISQQIKTLEGILGFNLFIRKKRTVELNERGADFYDLAVNTLETYEKGFIEFLEKNQTDLIRISTIPYIANEVLIPELDKYLSEFPQLKFSIQSSMTAENPFDSKLDAAIRFGKPPWHGYDVRLIAPAEANIVATQAYFKKHKSLVEQFSLDGHTILSDRGDQDWQRLKQLLNVPGEPARELIFDNYHSVIEAARQGLGLAICLFPISNKELSGGLLKAASASHYPLEEGFYFVSRQDEAKEKYLEALYDWLQRLFTEL